MDSCYSTVSSVSPQLDLYHRLQELGLFTDTAKYPTMLHQVASGSFAT